MVRKIFYRNIEDIQFYEEQHGSHNLTFAGKTKIHKERNGHKSSTILRTWITVPYILDTCKDRKETQNYLRYITMIYQYYWITITRKRLIFHQTSFSLFMQLNPVTPSKHTRSSHFHSLQKIYSRGYEGVTFRNVNFSEGHKEGVEQPFWLIGRKRIATSFPNLQKSTISRVEDRSLFHFLIFRQFIPELLQCFGIKTERRWKK